MVSIRVCNIGLFFDTYKVIKERRWHYAFLQVMLSDIHLKKRDIVQQKSLQGKELIMAESACEKRLCPPHASFRLINSR